MSRIAAPAMSFESADEAGPCDQGVLAAVQPRSARTGLADGAWCCARLPIALLLARAAAV